jgi:hypothetical protein
MLQNSSSAARQSPASFASLPTTTPPARIHLSSDWDRQLDLERFREWCSARGLLIVGEETLALIGDWVCTDFEVEGPTTEIGDLAVLNYLFGDGSLNRLLELLELCGQS